MYGLSLESKLSPLCAQLESLIVMVALRVKLLFLVKSIITFIFFFPKANYLRQSALPVQRGELTLEPFTSNPFI